MGRYPQLVTFALLAGSAVLTAVRPSVDARAPAECPHAAAVAEEFGRAAPEPVAPAPLEAETESEAERLFRQANAHLLRGETVLAHVKLERCVDVDPEFALCHRSLGTLYAGWGKPKAAYTHLKRYVELAPDAPDARAIRGIVERLGRMLPGR